VSRVGRLYNVAHRRTVGIVTRLLARWPRWLSDRKEIFDTARGTRLINKNKFLKW